MWAKIGLTIWLIYHLTTILILANGNSLAARQVGPYVLSYANALGLNASWNFFSPDPAHTMYFQYKVRFEDEQGNTLKEPIEDYLPPTKEKLVFNSSERRLLYAMRFLIIDPVRTEQIMAPWLCRTYPGASEVRIRHFVHLIPLLDQVLASPDLSISQLRKEKETQSLSYNCRETPNEVSQ